MSLDHWLPFIAAAVVILAIPGPNTIMVISHALGHGRTAARATVAGVAMGDLCAMTASMVGLGAVLSTSATLFTTVKFAGAAYLIYLGVRLWRAQPDHGPTPADDITASATQGGRLFLHSYAVSILNPKSIMFFVAFLPQFVETSRPLLPQLLILVSTYVLMSVSCYGTWSYIAAAARTTIRQPHIQRVINRTGGVLMIGAGVVSALLKRA